jgi:hypothetical protein
MLICYSLLQSGEEDVSGGCSVFKSNYQSNKRSERYTTWPLRLRKAALRHCRRAGRRVRRPRLAAPSRYHAALGSPPRRSSRHGLTVIARAGCRRCVQSRDDRAVLEARVESPPVLGPAPCASSCYSAVR